MPIAVVSVPVSDVDRAIRFYVDTLGFTLLEDEPMGPTMRWVQVQPASGGATIALTTWFDALSPGGQQGLMIHVDDVDAEHARLSAAGIELSGLGDQPWGRAAMLKDPDGNGLVLATLTAPDQIRSR
ncbi:VOC family protein [Sphingomonas sp.]|jgi:catechol 2,3-dioxygenase-like lactoylglutathione lyase family enzyme|uniref:VOC family protein n=1 Tax=Sphingomonas sp. TaxID=28214 RepID=UPI002E2F7503|nr:VOC family protein [Sphingomonas sp.]HEX4694351.1 VOC family protein [Sphingomonas sp.]